MSQQNFEPPAIAASAGPACYPPVGEHFELLARTALTLPRHQADPVGVFDAMERMWPMDLDGTRRLELLQEWRRRRHEFPWYLPDSV